MKNRFRLDSKVDKEKEIMDYLKLSVPEMVQKLLFKDYWIEINTKLVNKLDIFNLKWLSDLEIEKLLNKFLSKKNKEVILEEKVLYDKLTIDDEEAIDYFNFIFKKALRFYENDLKWKLPTKYKNEKVVFNNKEDIIKFLKDTSKWIQSSQFNCTMAKISYAVNEIIDLPELLELDRKSIYLAKEKIIPSTIIDDYDMLVNFWNTTWKVIVLWKIINFKIRMRWKEVKSWIFKILKDEKYLKWNDLNDAIWLEFEIEDRENALLLLSYFYNIIFYKKEDDWEIVNTINSFKNKWIITKEIIEKLETEKLISWEFLNLVKNLNFKPNPMQNIDYKDAKIIWEVDLPINLNDNTSQKKAHSVELRVILVWNINEEWLSDHRILDIWKIILTWIKLKWYITEPFMKHLINDLLNANKDLDEKFGKNEILNYFKSKLVEVERKWDWKIFTIKNRNMSNIYKNMEE